MLKNYCNTSETEIRTERREVLKKIGLIFLTPSFLYGKRAVNDSDYKYQEKVFKLIGLDRIFREFPNLKGKGVKIGYSVVYTTDLAYDIGNYKNINLESSYRLEEMKKDKGHANGMISIIGAKRNNWNGIAGIVPKAKITSYSSRNEYIQIKDMYEDGNKIIGSSFTYWQPRSEIKKIKYFLKKKKNLILICAGGNDGHKVKDKKRLYPLGGVKDVFTTGASDLSGKIHDFSAKQCDFYINTGEKEIFKGVAFRSSNKKTVIDNKTSQASAILTGIIGLIREILPNSSRKEVRKILQKTAKKQYADGGYLVDAYQAIIFAKVMF